ncbi:hypothetical protein [Desulfovibrio sp. 6_1_46AFAA]|uniref:hypothetical protein n=1 Tax=Desulfovibrio sp. 6_1_46AFAA TaxID=665942 RepID=UPI0012E9DBF3|nr:hypothetical protein [Desulfovibrio sp. 6_1_46AFAA]
MVSARIHAALRRAAPCAALKQFQSEIALSSDKKSAPCIEQQQQHAFSHAHAAHGPEQNSGMLAETRRHEEKYDNIAEQYGYDRWKDKIISPGPALQTDCQKKTHGRAGQPAAHSDKPGQPASGGLFAVFHSYA